MNIGESMHKILTQSDTLADLFYLVFLEKYPEVQVHFQGVDMRRQNVLLTMALAAVERHYQHRYPATAAYLTILGRQHKARGIGRELYPNWRDALMATLERFHAQEWDEGLAMQWRVAIDAAIECMLDAYN